ncbi:hypothetical protein ASD56_08960 [Microbacterium sp. Root166]|uniref:DUF3846 domain-containing protein n=1 Tax=Microbacterium sp. Root166 TaxID=1736478 RepID=UPI0006F1E88A|nr:DUF3846 domain-containing protein [Microbacterium sp. Root166]KQZ84133.1 hypothetical protein ASD56_08960 [Microbacterium sp. Root166]
MVRGIVIPAAGEEPLEERDFAELEDYQSAVGGWIEAVDIPSIGVTVYVNEEGLLRQLSFNSRATFLWWHEVPEVRQKAMLVGDAVVVGLPDRRDESTDVPLDIADRFTKRADWRVEIRRLGDSEWYGDDTTYRDYFEALVWAMITVSRWEVVDAARITSANPNQDVTC